MSCSASGLTSFLSVYGYQLPLFPDLEPELEVPFALSLIRWWCPMLSQTHRHFCGPAPLIPDCSSRSMSLLAPISQPGQMVWPTTQGLEVHYELNSFFLLPVLLWCLTLLLFHISVLSLCVSQHCDCLPRPDVLHLCSIIPPSLVYEFCMLPLIDSSSLFLVASDPAFLHSRFIDCSRNIIFLLSPFYYCECMWSLVFMKITSNAAMAETRACILLV